MLRPHGLRPYRLLHRGLVLSILLGLSLLGLSPTTWALSSVCSVTPSSQGGHTLKHEATWSLHDNWFYNLYAQVRTEVDGPLSLDQVDATPLQAGGHLTHLLAEPVDGHYTLRGEVQVGYPEPWGFDGYYTLECPTWQGSLATQTTDSDATEEREAALASAPDSNATAAAVPATFDELLAQACGDDGDPQACAYLQSLSEAERQQMLADRHEARQPLIQATGFIAAIDAQTLTVRTTTGRYHHFALPPEPSLSITRHTQALLTAIREGDQVFVQRPPSAQYEARIQVLRGNVDLASLPVLRRPHPREQVNRSALQSQVQAQELATALADNARTVSAPNTATTLPPIHLTYVQDESTLDIPADSTVTLVAPALFSALEPMRRYVRVIAHPSEQDGGAPVVRAVEILH